MASSADPFEAHLQRAASLFVSGDIVQAGQIWQAILKRNPDHEEARAGLYKVKLYFDARATQGGLASAVPKIPAPPPAPSIQADAIGVDEIPMLLDQGCTLYDSGLFEEALSKWNKVLELEPGNTLARGYADGARRALGMEPLPDHVPSAIQAHPLETTPPPEDSPIETTHLATMTEALPSMESHSEPAPQLIIPHQNAIDVEQLLRDGCTLFDMGETESALRKWEQVLAADPHHGLALEYVRSARKDLGLPPLEESAPLPRLAEAAPVSAPSSPIQGQEAEDERLENMMRDAVQLYDMGMTDEAIAKWEQVLLLKPDHREAQDYLKMAKRDLATVPPVPLAIATPPVPTPVPPPPKSAPPSTPQPPPPPRETGNQGLNLAPLFREADYLLSNKSFDGAAQAFQKILALDPSNGPALQGYKQARTMAAAKAKPQIIAREESQEAPQEAAPAESLPPESVVSPTKKLRRSLDIEGPLRDSGLLPILQNPKIVLGTLGGIIAVIFIGFTVHHQQKEALLRKAVAGERADALAKVAQNSEVEVLSESAESIRKEAESAMPGDPLFAYFRAQELIRLNPGDAAAAQLLERAKAACSQAQPKGNLKDLEKMLQERDLESAQALVTEMLKQAPDDATLRGHAMRLHLAIARIEATQGHWDKAKDQLKHGRAISPSDKGWAGRMALLTKLQGLSASERNPWLQLLD